MIIEITEIMQIKSNKADKKDNIMPEYIYPPNFKPDIMPWAGMPITPWFTCSF